MQISDVDNSGQNIVQFMNYLVGNNILISEQSAISEFGHFTIDSYTVKRKDSYIKLNKPFW